METDYEKIYEDAIFELELLISKKKDMEREIARKKQFVISLGRMLGKPDAELADIPFSLKTIIIETLRAANEPLAPSQIIHRVREYAPNFFSNYKNPLPPVTTTLKRLVKAKQVSASKIKGKTVYNIKE